MPALNVSVYIFTYMCKYITVDRTSLFCVFSLRVLRLLCCQILLQSIKDSIDVLKTSFAATDSQLTPRCDFCLPFSVDAVLYRLNVFFIVSIVEKKFWLCVLLLMLFSVVVVCVGSWSTIKPLTFGLMRPPGAVIWSSAGSSNLSSQIYVVLNL